MAESQTLKHCTCCERARPALDCLVSKFTVDGLTDTCRPCIFARAAEYRAACEARERRRSERNQHGDITHEQPCRARADHTSTRC